MIKNLATFLLITAAGVAAQGTVHDDMASRLATTVRALSQEIGQRGYLDAERLERAAAYIEGKLRSYGYTVKRQPFAFQGKTYVNIIAESTGTDPEKKEILVIGAHYDTVAGTPGADDNASGIAGLLELARLAAEKPLPRTVRFAAFSLEEPPAFGTEFMGSHAYAKSLSGEGVKVRGMISLEMIGFFCDRKDCQRYPLSCIGWFYPDRGDYIALVGNRDSKAFTKALKKAFSAVSSFPLETLNAPSFVTGVDFSDHRNFWKFGYPAVMMTDTSFYRNPHYHQESDTAEKLDYGKMAELVTGLDLALRGL